MIGNNTFYFNEATAKEAFEEYLNKRAIPSGSVKVISVSDTNQGFKVCVKPLELLEEGVE